MTEPVPNTQPTVEPVSTGALIVIHFLEAAHCGTGNSGNGVKKQIQREVQTGWPTIYRRSIKGAIRSACCESVFILNWKSASGEQKKKFSRSETNRDTKELTAAFGPASISGADDGQMGAVRISPGSMLAFPVCSLSGVFAWVTCPEVFRRLKQNLHARGFAGLIKDLPDLSSIDLNYRAGDIITLNGSNLNSSDKSSVRLGKMEFARKKLDSTESSQFKTLVNWFNCNAVQSYMLPPDPPAADVLADVFGERLAMVSNEAFTYITRFATQKVQGNALDYDTKTVDAGKLFSIEYLPQETLMYATINASEELTSSRERLSAIDLFDFVANSLKRQNDVMQFGGEQSKDSGIASLKWNNEPPPATIQTSGASAGEQALGATS